MRRGGGGRIDAEDGAKLERPAGKAPCNYTGRGERSVGWAGRTHHDGYFPSETSRHAVDLGLVKFLIGHKFRFLAIAEGYVLRRIMIGLKNAKIANPKYERIRT